MRTLGRIPRLVLSLCRSTPREKTTHLALLGFPSVRSSSARYRSQPFLCGPRHAPSLSVFLRCSPTYFFFFFITSVIIIRASITLPLPPDKISLPTRISLEPIRVELALRSAAVTFVCMFLYWITRFPQNNLLAYNLVLFCV